MQIKIHNRITENTTETSRSRKADCYTLTGRIGRGIRVSLPLMRRESCLTRRALLAALREAEFNNWQATGGDYLSSMHQPVD